MSVLTIIALVAGGLLVLNFAWTPVTNWIKSRTPDKVDAVIDEMSQLRTNLNLWIDVRLVPNLSTKAIELLDALKEELLKYEERVKEEVKEVKEVKEDKVE